MVDLKLRYSIVVECWQTNLHVIVCKCVCWGCNKMRIGQKWAAAPKLFCCAAKMKHQKFRSPPAFFNESKEGASQSTTTISLPASGAFHWAYERKVLEILWASKGKKCSEKKQSKKYFEKIQRNIWKMYSGRVRSVELLADTGLPLIPPHHQLLLASALTIFSAF